MGVLGLSPSPPGGENAVYEVASGRMMLNLRNTVPRYRHGAPSPFHPWSPNGRDVLVEEAVYTCSACGRLDELQAAARTRMAWSAPLSSAKDGPPRGDPFR
jgi:hypothetical protein